MSNINKLQNLNNLNDGIYKHWIWGCDSNYHKICDYLQKINYCIQDLNTALENGLSASMKDVIFVIVLVDWIKEAYIDIESSLLDGIVNDFKYSKNEDLIKAGKFIAAIRSFIVAHPLKTNRHKDYGLDGSKICVDIRPKNKLMVIIHDNDWYHLDIDGMHQNAKSRKCDFILYIYDDNFHNSQFFQYVGCNYSDIFKVAELYIDKLHEMARYLNKLKRKEWQ